jgi:hypothetical protein
VDHIKSAEKERGTERKTERKAERAGGGEREGKGWGSSESGSTADAGNNFASLQGPTSLHSASPSSPQKY